MTTNLSPAQQRAFDMLKHTSAFGHVLVLFSDTGLGKSTVLGKIHHEFGGAILNMKDFMAAISSHHPLALEEAFNELVMSALKDHPVNSDECW